MFNEDLTEPSLTRAPNELTSCFKDLTLKTILSEWQKQNHSFINARLDGYIDGKSAPFEQKELQDLASLDKSFRLTNVQLFVPQLKKFCHDFEKQRGHILSVNLYYTPHSEAQCFDYHQDSQHSFSYQLLGEKNWTFLRHQEEFLKETHEQEHVLNSFKKGKIKGEEVNFKMEQGSSLEFPYCFIHKARNESNSPSAHLTFSYNVPTVGDLALHYFECLLGQKVSDRYLDRMLLTEVKSALKNFNGDHQLFIESYKKKFKLEQELKKIEGRRYQ